MGSNFNISGVWQSINDLWLPIALAIVGIIVLVFLVHFIAKKKGWRCATVIVAGSWWSVAVSISPPPALSNIRPGRFQRLKSQMWR